MLNFFKEYLMMDMRLFGGLLYKITKKLERFPILQAVVGIVYIAGTKFDLAMIDLIERRTGA